MVIIKPLMLKPNKADLRLVIIINVLSKKNGKTQKFA